MNNIEQAKSVEQIERAFQDHKVVIHKLEDGTNFILNPFGGGTTATQELLLADDFTLTPERLARTFIVS